MFNVYLTARRGALLGASGDQTALPAESPAPGQTVAKLFEAMFVVLDALMFASFLFLFFDVLFSLPSEPPGVDFELPSRPSDPQKLWFYQWNINIFEEKKNACDPKMVLEAFWGSRGAFLGALGHPLGALKGF